MSRLTQEVKFKTIKFELGEVGAKDVINLKSICEKGYDNIDYVYSSCGCGTPTLNDQDQSLDVIFDVAASVGELNKGHSKPISRFIYVKLNPESRQFLRGNGGRRIDNKDNKIIRFQISGIATG